MKYSGLIIAIITLLLTDLFHPFVVKAEGYYFDEYQVHVVVHPDNTYSVNESIDVIYTLSSHGFYRTLPTSAWIKRDTTAAQDRSGAVMRHYPITVKDINVSTAFTVFDENNCKDIRIGSSDIEVIGPQHYDISYTLSLPNDRIEQADLYFHSLLGTGNECETRHFSFLIDFDEAIPEGYLSQLQVFTGNEGNNEDHANQVITHASNTRIEGEVSDLLPYQGVSIYLPLPEGYFTISVPYQTYVSWFLILVTSLIFLHVLRKEIFRDYHVTPVVSFYPPEGISSAEVGTLIDCEVDDVDLISLIPEFANKGYLTIEQRTGYTHLTKRQDFPDSEPEYQRILFNALFDGRHVFDTNQNTSRKFGRCWLEAKAQLIKAHEGKLDTVDGSVFIWQLIGIALTVLTYMYAIVASDNGFSAIAIGIYLGLVTVIMYGLCGKNKIGAFIVTIPIVFFGMLVVYGVADEGVFDDFYVPTRVAYGFFILAFCACFFSLRLGIMTPYRKERMGEIQGLRDFIKTAEESRLQMLLDKDEQYFYHILPYAVAFGLVDKWAKKFERLTIVPNDNMPGVTTFRQFSRDFYNDNVRKGVSDELQARAAAAAKAARQRASSGSSYSSSRSYSSGGGGYSGGGFGGGGSRRW